jgi:threonine/homoserine/homoserine lactone efflux protein
MSLLLAIPVFAGTALLLAIVPGQGVAMILRQSLIGGRRCALISVLGNTSGLLVWGLASSIGLSAVFAHSLLAYNILKYLGVAYLSLLAFRTLLELRNVAGKFDFNGTAQTSSWSAYRLGLFTNLTNVKAAVFAVAFIPQFVPRGFALAPGIMILALVQSVVSTSWYFTLIFGISRAEKWLSRPKVRRWLTGFSAIGILFLAVVLLLSSSR